MLEAQERSAGGVVIGPLSTRGFDGLDRRLTHRHRLSDRRQPTRDVAHSPVDGNRRPGPRHGCLVPVVRADRRPRRDRGLGQHAPLGRHPGSHERWLTAGRSAVTTTGSGADRTRSARPPQPSLLLELGRFDSALAVGNHANCPVPRCDALPRATAFRLRLLLSNARHSGQCRCTGDRRSTTRWQRRHSSRATFSHSRERLGWGSEISLEVSPSERSKWPAPARRSQDLSLTS